MSEVPPKEFEDYVQKMTEDYITVLQQMKFEDETNYLMAIQYNANLIWEISKNLGRTCYYHKDTMTLDKDTMLSIDKLKREGDPCGCGPQGVIMWLDTSLLSLHPNNLLGEKDITEDVKKSLADLSKFRDLILLKDYNVSDVDNWNEVARNMNTSADLSLMVWFITLASKLTGNKMEGAGFERKDIGGKLQKDRKEIEGHLNTMANIGQVLYEKNKKYINPLRGMYKNLHRIVFGFDF